MTSSCWCVDLRASPIGPVPAAISLRQCCDLQSRMTAKMSLQRSVEPEWLDQLAAKDPRRHRRDLKLINALMLQLAEHWQGSGPRSLLDVGSGDGTFMLRVARRLAARWPDVTVT